MSYLCVDQSAGVFAVLPAAGVCDVLRPVRQSAACAGDDRHAGARDLPGLVEAVCGAPAQTTGSGDPHTSSPFL